LILLVFINILVFLELKLVYWRWDHIILQYLFKYKELEGT